jgi:hypothetical protein
MVVHEHSLTALSETLEPRNFAQTIMHFLRIPGSSGLYKNQEKKEKVESRKTCVRKNTPFSAFRSQIALRTPEAYEVLRIAHRYTRRIRCKTETHVKPFDTCKAQGRDTKSTSEDLKDSSAEDLKDSSDI